MTASSRAAAIGARLPGVVRQHGALLANASSMMSTTLVTSGLGVVFWLVAARYFSETAVGISSAAVSAMTLLGFATTLGMGTLLMGELPQRPGAQRSLLDAALAVTTAAGVALGLLFAALVPLFSSELESLGGAWTSALVFALGCGLMTAGYVVDQAMIGLLRGRLQLLRNVVFSAVKLAALVPVALLLDDPKAVWIYGVWGAGVAVSMLVFVGFYREVDGGPLRPDFSELGLLRGSAASHHGFNLALLAPSMVVPIVVVAFISAEANAAFYVAWMIAGFISMVPVSLGTVLYAVAAGDPSRLRSQLRLTCTVSFAAGVAANLVLIFAAEPLLRIFGASYADEAAFPLHVLALGVFPLTLKTGYVALQRVRRRTAAALPVAIVGTLLEIGGAAAGAAISGDLSGVAWGWLAGLGLEVALMAYPVIRALRGEPVEGPPPADEARVSLGR